MTSPPLRRLYARLVFWPTLAWNLLLGRVLHLRRWWDRIDPQVILGARPFSRDVPILHADGVRAVVNTCEEYEGPVDAYRKFGIEQLHLPTTDFVHPSAEDVETAVEFIQRHADRGETVYVHCKAGRARSATIAICWLIKYRGLTPQQAQTVLSDARPHVNRRLTQRPVVRAFAANHCPADRDEAENRHQPGCASTRL